MPRGRRRAATQAGNPLSVPRSTAVGTGFGIEAFVRYAQTLDRTARDEVLRDNFGSVFGLNVSVPDCFRVNDHCGTMFALVETKRFVDTHTSGEAGFFAELLQAGVQFTLPIAGAGWPGSLGRAYVVAYEDVVFKPGQTGILLARAGSRVRPRWHRSEVSTIGQPNPPASAKIIA